MYSQNIMLALLEKVFKNFIKHLNDCTAQNGRFSTISYCIILSSLGHPIFMKWGRRLILVCCVPSLALS